MYCVACTHWTTDGGHTETHTQTEYNKAIRDGKYLARHMPVLGNVHPIKFENIDIFS